MMMYVFKAEIYIVGLGGQLPRGEAKSWKGHISLFSVIRGEYEKRKKKDTRKNVGELKIPRFDKFPEEYLHEGRLKSA